MKAGNFTEEDLVRLVEEKDARIVNFCHIAEDGRLKTLSFTVENRKRLHEILEFGERVDGSSLFSYLDPKKSDIYIMPKIESAFFNPFTSVPTLNILCEYLDEKGKPLDVAPRNILLKAEERLRSNSDIVLNALAELEFYLIGQQQENIFRNPPETNYHESAPFVMFESIRNEALTTLANVGIATKYGHSEVGGFYSNSGQVMEQHEIELLPQNLNRMAESIAIAKWVIRNICARHGVSVSFSPKVALQHAGSGMHIHLCGLKKGENVIADHQGNLTAEAKQMIGGILKLAPSITAFGNTIPISYLRFISRKESPMHICWGTRNRLALLRVPLWWNFEKDKIEMNGCRRTFEFRGPDASANAYLLLAGMVVAVEYGLNNPEKAMKITEDLSTEKTTGQVRRYQLLPRSCSESARNLRKDRAFYEAEGVFPKSVINGTIGKLEAYQDELLWKKLSGKPREIEKFLCEYLNYG